MSQEERILSVSELTCEIRQVLEGKIGTIWVEGEISNHRLQTSGHQYFTLKDSRAQLSCVMFRGAATRLGSRGLQDGVQVQLQGEISVYEPRGQYQLIVRQVQLKGQGDLQAQFEALKRRLHAEGLFDEDLKKEIPPLPEVIALVTSPTGAAIQDMLQILTRRAPWLHILVFPVRVQGAGVEQETIRALKILNSAAQHHIPKPDTIIIGRGGGSLEDLWAYNQESLARAIAASEIPIISAVGHEIDFTIADFVADLRAPTPSAAAELIAPDQADLLRQLQATQTRLAYQTSSKLAHLHQHLQLLAKGALHHSHQRQLQSAEQHLDELDTRLHQSPKNHLQSLSDLISQHHTSLLHHHPRLLAAQAAHQLQTQATRLHQAIEKRLQNLENRLASRQELLHHLGPDSVLKRGFSYTLLPNGKTLQNPADLKPGDLIITQLRDGKVKSIVQDPET